MDDFKNNIEQTFLVLMVFSLIAIVVMLIMVLRLGIRESDKFLKPIQNLIGGVQEISLYGLGAKLRSWFNGRNEFCSVGNENKARRRRNGNYERD